MSKLPKIIPHCKTTTPQSCFTTLKNCAGTTYLPRDCEILKNTSHNTQNAENGQIMQYLYHYTNNNVHIFDLIGTRHTSAPLRASYKQLRCLVDNDGDIVMDLERLF